jgi:hypothetical protein
MKPRMVLVPRRMSLALAASAVLASSCGHSTETPQIVAPGLTATAASASFVPTSDSIASSLTITNKGTTTQIVQFAPCTYLGPLTLRVYATGSSKPAWDSALDNNEPCFTGTESVTLNAGAAHVFQQVTDINEILGDSLAAGSYMLTVSGRYLTPAVTTEMANATLSLAKHTVAAATFSFTTDSSVYSASAGGIPPFVQYVFTVIARYANTGTTPIALLNACGPHPSWNIWGVGNNVGISPYDPLNPCFVPTSPLIVAPGTARVDTIQLRGPTETAADGTPLGPLYGQFRITYRAGANCNTSTLSACGSQASTVFAVRIPQ